MGVPRGSESEIQLAAEKVKAVLSVIKKRAEELDQKWPNRNRNPTWQLSRPQNFYLRGPIRSVGRGRASRCQTLRHSCPHREAGSHAYQRARWLRPPRLGQTNPLSRRPLASPQGAYQ